MLLAILGVLLEVVTGFVGAYSLWRGINVLRRLSVANTPAAVWREVTPLLLWTLGSAVGITLCALVGGRSLTVILLALILAVVLLGTGLLLSIVRFRALSRPAVLKPGAPTVSKVVLRRMVPGRVRGLDGGRPVYLQPDEEEGLRGTSGNVRMIPWQSALNVRSATESAVPIMGFWTKDGVSLLLYPDDDVALVQELVHER